MLYLQFYNISISADKGAMIIDKLEIELFDEFSDECTPDGTASTGKPGGTQPPTTPGGADAITVSFLLLSTAALYAVGAAISSA